ncbi:MAG: hypothetical protein K0S22_632 [Oscillospiraceae bacterium]|jgi:AcrR family transcriptional regulator|nr:hypothetical protein [Oscillospiraceae bacterium]
MKKRDEQTLQTKEKLTDAFWVLYSQKPYDQITVREITELAGFNRSTFYTYYKDVYNVLEQAEDEIYQLLEEEFERCKYVCNKEQMTGSVRFMGAFLEKNKKRLMLLLGENGDVKFAHRILQEMRDRLRIRLSEADMEPVIFEYVVEYIMNAHVGLTMRWFKNGCDISFEKMAELIFMLTSGGLVSVLTGQDAVPENFSSVLKAGEKDKPQ